MTDTMPMDTAKGNWTGNQYVNLIAGDSFNKYREVDFGYYEEAFIVKLYYKLNKDRRGDLSQKLVLNSTSMMDTTNHIIFMLNNNFLSGNLVIPVSCVKTTNIKNINASEGWSTADIHFTCRYCVNTSPYHNFDRPAISSSSSRSSSSYSSSSSRSSSYSSSSSGSEND
jgi:hypothetical protein